MTANRGRRPLEAFSEFGFPECQSAEGQMSKEEVVVETATRKPTIGLPQFGENPYDKFDVANRVARIMGVEVAKVVTPGYVGKTESAALQPEDDEPEGQSEEEIRDIASNLRYAMPIRRNPETGKMERKKFNLKRIKERSKKYEANKRVFMQGRKIKGGQ